jgi:hypothetical protein
MNEKEVFIENWYATTVYLRSIYIYKVQKIMFSVMPTSLSVFHHRIMVVAFHNADFIPRFPYLCFTCILVTGPLGRSGKGYIINASVLPTLVLICHLTWELGSTRIHIHWALSCFHTTISGWDNQILSPIFGHFLWRTSSTIWYNRTWYCLFLALIIEMWHDLPESMKE